MIDPLQIQLIPIRGIEALIYFLCYLLLSKKQKLKENNKPGYVLNTIYMKFFLYWALYMICDTLASVILPLSFNDDLRNMIISQQNLGFLSFQYPSWVIGNILRDLQITFTILHLYYTYKASQVIKYGEEMGVERFGRKIGKKQTKILFTLLAITGVYFDGLVLTIDSSGNAIVSKSWDVMGPLGWLVFIIYIIILTHSLLIPIKEYFKNRNTLEGKAKESLYFFNVGCILFISVIYYWVVVPLIDTLSGIPITTVNPLLYEIIGHIISTSAPITYYYALQVKGSNE